MSVEVRSGLEGVVAFRTEIAEPDKEGGALRYRGVDIEDLVGNVPFEKVWGLLVDGEYEPGLPPAIPYPIPMRTGDTRVDVQAALAQLAPNWGFRQLLDISDEEARDDLARASVMALSFVAQSARGTGQPPVPQTRDRQGALDPGALPDPLARRGRPGPRQGHRRLLDLGRRARDERVDLHRPGRRVDRRRRGRRPVGRGRSALGPAARRRALARAADARRRGASRRRREVRQGGAGPRRPADGLRPPRLPRRGPARPGAAPHRARDRRAAPGGGREAREGRAGRAARALPGPRPGHQRRVLVRGRARLRRRAAGPVHADVRLRARGRLVGAHPRSRSARAG